MAIWFSPILNQLHQLRYFFLLFPILLIADLHFGVKAAKKRGERVKRSRAVKRTLNKFVDYICWLLLAGALGLAFGEPFNFPILPTIIMAIVISIEIESSLVNYFEYRGRNVKINWKGLFGKRIKEILDDTIEDKEEKIEDKEEKSNKK